MKKFLSIMLVLAAFLAFSVLAYAEGESFTMTLTPAEGVTAGENVTITATATNNTAVGGLISLDYYVAIPAGVTYQSVAFNGTVDGWNVQANVVNGTLRVFAVNDSCTAAVETISIDMVFATTEAGSFVFTLSEVEGSASNGAYVTGTTASCTAVIEDNTPPAEVKNGIYEENGKLYYYENDVKVAKGLVKVDGAIYYAGGNGLILRATSANGKEATRYTEYTGITISTGYCVQQSISEAKMNGVLPYDASNKYYLFGEDGKMLDETFGCWGKYGLSWIVKGQPCKVSKAVIYEDVIYFITSGGATANKGLYRVKSTQQNGIIPTSDYYMFNYEDGSLMNNRFAIWTEKWGEAYVVNGRPATQTMIVDDGDTIALVVSGGRRGKGLQTIKQSYLNGHEDVISAGTYMFDSNGHLHTGFAFHNQKFGIRYYVNGVIANSLGIVEDGGNLYYIKSAGSYAKDEYVVVTEAKANSLIAAGTYYFNADGILQTN